MRQSSFPTERLLRQRGRRPDRVRRAARRRPYTTQHVRPRMGHLDTSIHTIKMHFSNHTCIPIFLLTLFVGLQLQCEYSSESHVFNVLIYDFQAFPIFYYN